MATWVRVRPADGGGRAGEAVMEVSKGVWLIEFEEWYLVAFEPWRHRM
jgi:hypothetical protein